MGRFVSADWAAVPQAVPYASLTDPQTLNLYGYVRNNPMAKADSDGHCFWDACALEILGAAAVVTEVVEGVVGGASAGAAIGSVAAVLANGPSHAMTPYGIGQNTGLTLANDVKSGNKGDSKPAPATEKKTGEPPQLKAGKDAHKAEEVRPGETPEVRTPTGKRMDRYDGDKAHIREIKPDNARGERAGQKQLDAYKKEMDQATDRSHTTELTKYPKKTQADQQ